MRSEKQTTTRGSTVLFAGGGSGGHISPGLAIAEQIQARDDGTRCLFAASNRSIDRTMLEEANAEYICLPAQPLLRTVRGVFAFQQGYRRTIPIVRQYLQTQEIDRVVALGGFVSAPVVSAAVRSGIPVILLNLDRVPGRANRWVARRATTVLSAVSTIEPHAHWSIVGLPIRQNARARGAPEEARRILDLDPQRETLLITGASQGARTINEVIPRVAASMPDAFADWQVLHLCGDSNVADTLQGRWQDLNIKARVIPFLHKIGQAWDAASVCISRAGANSVAEARFNSVPTIFLPYPHHRDQHQQHNAMPMVELGGAVIVQEHENYEATTAALAPELLRLVTDHEHRSRMRNALVREPNVDAAALVADHVLSMHDPA